MKLRKSSWFFAIREELLRRGFVPSTACPRLFSSYQNASGLVVEIRGGNTLRIVMPGGAYESYRAAALSRAIKLICEAEASVA
jgi:hypothetical protein